MAKIYYVGDWAISLGPVFAETPFSYADKGLDTFYYGRWLKEALASTGEHPVEQDAPTVYSILQDNRLQALGVLLEGW